ncbi:MAG: hypothetical protein AAFU77_16940 [Myxococcota bacterium]
MDPDIEVFGCADMSVSRQRVGADDQILNVVGVERAYEIDEVGALLHHLGSTESIGR